MNTNLFKFRKMGRMLLCLLLFAALVFQTALPAATVFAAQTDRTKTISTYCADAERKKYTITAKFGADAGIPDDAALKASVIPEDDEDYEEYAAQAIEAIDLNETVETQVRLFDISIVSAADETVEYQPVEGAKVDMKIRLAEAAENELSVVHLGEEAEVLETDIVGRNVSFEATGFSVYALIDLPEYYTDRYVDSAEDFDQQPLYISATVETSHTYYMSSGIVYDSKNKHYVIDRTPENSTAGAVPYYFEKISGTTDQYYVYYLNGETANYVKMTKNTGMDYVASTADATAFTVEPVQDSSPNKYYIRTTAKQSGKYYYLNLRKDTNGKGFGGSDYGPMNNLSSAGSELLVEKELPRDLTVTGLNGKTYGIVSIGQYNNAFAVSVDALDETTLNTLSVAERANPVEAGGKVVVRVGEDIPTFTFRDDGSGKYLVSVPVGGTTKYLSIRKNAAVLVDTPDEWSHLTVLLGTDVYAGKVSFTAEAAGGGSLYAVEYGSGGFTGKTKKDNYSYFCLAEKIEIENDDLVPYTADKISVQDIRNGQDVVIYTRVWDDTEKQYVLYGVNHDGTLVRLYDEGETVRWSGTQINTMLWEFTEYYSYTYSWIFPFIHKTPNNYYEFRNTYSQKYLAPQYSTGQILSNRTIGVNLNGRRNNQHYSTIIAWDTNRYDYAGLKAGDGILESVRMSKAQDFYFAVMHPQEGELTTAETLDNNDFGIDMKMVLFPRELESGGRNSLQTEVIGNSAAVTDLKFPSPNLASTTLENGYPTALLTGRSMEELFGSATDVNHLFLTQVYQESGYFQYDSTQNFATLLDAYGNISDRFTVYNELGTPEVSTNSQGHSQFMPYNDLDTSIISAYTNIKDVFNEPLELDDPRLGEQLYSIPSKNANYHFGMQMEASFVQSRDGKDAWGHDIIFEFAGDDDMWFYVDDELVLDLGGIHSALVGKINFCTGDVQIPHATEPTGNHATPVYTTLREIFAQNFIERENAKGNNYTADSPEVIEHLNKYFKEGTSVFKDYTTHTMKMFYMERGAGASNLIMRFNLTTSEEGQLMLSKEITGTDKNDYSGAQFPFQIYYKDDFGEFIRAKHTADFTDGSTDDQYEGVKFVNYQGTTDPVAYEASYNGYDDVFFIKPGETAVIQFPSEDMEYYIQECGIDATIFDEVYANSIQLNGTPNGDYFDYSTLPEVIGKRKIVKYENHVSPSALMTLEITKELYQLLDRPEDRLHYADDDTGFRFRVYIGNEDNYDDLDYYRFGDYYVKDPDGQYCRYDYQTQKFVQVGDGITDFSLLTEEQKEDCRFYTSPSGAIDQIPTDFTVEIRDLFMDTRYKIIERDTDIPKGYGFIEYVRDPSTVHEGETANTGTIHRGENPCVVVKNHRGWGLTVEKYWSDDDFMLSHGNIYFAIYNGEPSPDNDEPIANTLRRMQTEVTEDNPEAEYSLYYYFNNLIEGAVFSDYIVKEVALVEPNADSDLYPMPEPLFDENGYVTNYAELTPYIRVLGGTEKLHIAGTDSQTQTESEHTYAVTYDVGTPTGPANNIRVDNVTNTRPGVKLLKTDANGNPLANAVFSITAEDILDAEFTSGSDGVVSIAYPIENVTYTVTELKTPSGYSALADSFSFTYLNGALTVTGDTNSAVTVTEDTESGMTVVSVKNYRTDFSAVKIDAVTNEPIEGAHFALYRQVIGKNGPRKDYYPLTGYESLVSDENGVIPGIDATLPAGTYYLDETAEPALYRPLGEDVCFTVDQKGNVSINDANAAAEDPIADVVSTVANNELMITMHVKNRRTFDSISLDPQTLVADFGLDISYDVTLNNHAVPANSVYTYIGIVPLDQFSDYGTEAAPKTILAAAGTNYKGQFGTVSISAAGIAHYSIDTMAFTGEDTFCLAAHVTKIRGNDADVYVYEKITYLPATTVYYEDDFVPDSNYINGAEGTATGHNFGTWSLVTSGAQETHQAADLAASDSANIFGYDPHYTEFATYSNNAAHKVSVSTVNAANKGGTWPYMEFDFAGTGFDVVSVTGCDTGVFTVRVYEAQTDAQGNLMTDSNGNLIKGSQVASKMIDTYYGCEYGKLYLDANGDPTLQVTNRRLYEATEAIIEEASPTKLLACSGKLLTPVVTYYSPSRAVTETPHYYDAKGNITTTEYMVDTTDSTNVIPKSEVPRDSTNFVPNYAYAAAEGWLVNPGASDSLYQIPAIKIRSLKYGAYIAHIEPRFTANYGHYETVDGYNYFDLYVDAFRVYDPAGVDEAGNICSIVIQEAYNYSNEAYEKFTTLKSVIVGSDTMGSYSDQDEAKEGIVVVDGTVPLDSSRLQDYAAFGPNNELYLGKDMAVAFEICASEIPADVQLQMKKISASFPKLRVTYAGKNGTVSTNEVEIRTATDLSYSILDMIGRDRINWTKIRNTSDISSGLVIISNTGADESVLSVTNLKWTFKDANGVIKVHKGTSTVAITPANVSSVKRIVTFSNLNTEVTESPDAPAAYLDGAIRMTVRSSDAVESLVVRDADGNLIDEDILEITFAQLDDTQREWTVNVAENVDDDYTFLIAGACDGFVSGAPLQLSVTVETELPDETEPASDPDDPTQPSAEPTTEPNADPTEPTTQPDPAQDILSGSRFAGLRNLLLRLIELLKRILATFGIQWN